MDEEQKNEEEEAYKLYRDVNVNLEGRDTEMTNAPQTSVQGFISNMLNPNPDISIDSILNLNTESTTLVDVPVTSNAEMPPSSATTPPPPPIPPIQPLQQTPVPIPTIIPNRLRDEAQAKNAYFINKLDDNIKKIIKEQVKVQVKDQVSKILPKIEKLVNDQLEAEVLTRSSNEAKTSHAIAANLLDTVKIKRCRDDRDEDEEPFAGSNRGSKRRRDRKEPKSTSAPKEKTSMSSDKSKEGSRSHNTSTGKSAQAEEPIHADEDLEEPAHQDNLAQKEDTRDSFNELMDTPLDFSAFVMNRLKVDTLTPELLAGPTFELMKGSCKSLVELEYFLEEVCKATTDKLDWNNPEGQQYPHDLRKPLPLIPNSQGRRVIPFDHFINNDLAYLRGGSSSRTYATSVTKTKAADYGHGRKRQQFYGFAVNRESARDVYSRHIIIAVTKLQIVEWHNYKHLDWITVHRNDDKLYTFKEGDYKRLHLQDIEDMLLLLVQGNQRRVEDLQLGVESYQKKLNLTRPDTYRSDLKILPTYSAYPNPKGFIYQNKDKKNKLMRIDELHKFSDGTLNDLRAALDDILKRIRMKYLPQTYWKKVDKDRARAMIQAIDKMLKNRRIMQSLEKFVEHAEYDESNTYVLERFNTTAGNPVKKILLKLNLSDHRLFKDGGGVKEFQRSFRHSDTERLSRSDEVLKLKNFKKDATLKLSKSTNQERYEHVGPEVASPQDGKVTRWRRDCAWLMISRCSRSQCQIQVQGTSSIQKSMITTTYFQEKVKSTS
ncbi:hypothetical protein Tco_0190289 [Tanacetum coccineum]